MGSFESIAMNRFTNLPPYWKARFPGAARLHVRVIQATERRTPSTEEIAIHLRKRVDGLTRDGIIEPAAG